MRNCIELLEKYYEKSSRAYTILLAHSQDVAKMAMEIVQRHPELHANADLVYEGAMLHDIGVFYTNAPSIDCHGIEPYIMHAFRGAEILRKEGLDKHALIAERHTGAGISKMEIEKRKLPLPCRDMIPESVEEEIVCFADKFFSKTYIGERFSVEEAKSKLEPFGKEGVERFSQWCKKFL